MKLYLTCGTGQTVVDAPTLDTGVQKGLFRILSTLGLPCPIPIQDIKAMHMAQALLSPKLRISERGFGEHEDDMFFDVRGVLFVQ